MAECALPYEVWSVPNEKGDSVLDRILRKLVEAQREQEYRNAQPSMMIVDSKSIQNADSAEEKGCDAGKKLPVSSCTSALMS